MHGELTFATPSFANDVHRRTSTFVYIMSFRAENADGISRFTSSRASDALPSGKWNVYDDSRNASACSGRPRPLKPTDPRRAASSAGVVSTRLLLRPPW